MCVPVSVCMHFAFKVYGYTSFIYFSILQKLLHIHQCMLENKLKTRKIEFVKFYLIFHRCVFLLSVSFHSLIFLCTALRLLWFHCIIIQFPAMLNLSLQRGDAFILVYDITKSETFEEVRRIRDDIHQVRQTNNVPIVVVGNKIDLAETETREVI